MKYLRLQISGCHWLLVSQCWLLLMVTGCGQQMGDQPRYEPLEESDFFRDGRASRRPPAGTVPHRKYKNAAEADPDSPFNTGRDGMQLVSEFPLAELGLEKIDEAFLARGQQRYMISCTPCHGAAGLGDGMVVQRGFRRPPSYHTDRLREQPHGHYFDVITRGIGVMPPFAATIEPRDRWAIVAYVRALQRSRNASLDDVPSDERKKLETSRGTQTKEPPQP